MLAAPRASLLYHQAAPPVADEERGSIALLVSLASLVVVALSLGAMAVVTDTAAAAARARTAADAAALAAAAAGPDSAHAAARRLAAANGATLVACCRVPRHVGHNLDVDWVVQVDVAVHPRTALGRLLGSPAIARAAATVDR